jgi:hypothetical protein
VVPTTTTGRPKTAHTTIERRYRTNLNTCIVGLRDSIPAVRYLDKGFKPSSGIPDVLDENGHVDGVKLARKISKATIMSKAREYIMYALILVCLDTTNCLFTAYSSEEKPGFMTSSPESRNFYLPLSVVRFFSRNGKDNGRLV